MWHCRTLVVPVVLGALGTVHAGIARWLDIIPGHQNLQLLQKTVLLGSTWILRKVMCRGLVVSENGYQSMVWGFKPQ